MKADFIARMSYEQMVKAYEAYTKLQAVYEDVCGGPYKAREYKEYFAMCEGREKLRLRCIELASRRTGNGDQQ